MSLSAESAGGLRDSEKCRDESIATGSTSSSSSSSKASSYRDKVLRAKEVESEVQKRLSQLYPSFDTSQPVSPSHQFVEWSAED